ncbi:MAG TPA: tetratricopeptide repeat protein [Terrimicrobiaceae bacterium]
MRVGVGVFLFGSAGVLFGQPQPFWEPEVRRAVPVEYPSSTPIQAPRAIPVAKPVATPQAKPVATPLSPPPSDPFENPDWMQRVRPSPSPLATPRPASSPYRPQGRIQVAPNGPPALPPAPVAPKPSPESQSGDIRLSPSTGSGEDLAEEELNLANTTYSRKLYDYAIQAYEKFLITYPSAKGRDTALFRLAECHRMLGNEESARAGYERLLQAFREGEFAGAGAYRLGEYLFAEKKYESALSQFQLAGKEAAGEEIRLSAKYNAARCLDRLKRLDEAAKFYREVASVQKNNPYLQYARLSLAENAATAGRKKEALESFSDIAEGSGPATVRAEAAVKAAALAAELDDKQRALKLFNLALGLPESGDWKPTAFLGAIRLNFETGAYKKVIEMSEKSPAGMPESERGEILLLAGDSQRQLGNARAARAIYDRLLLQLPNSPSSSDARFHRLLSMYQLDDPKLVQEADDFLQRSTDPLERAQANLLKAESLFKQKKFAEATPIYAKVGDTGLANDLKIKALYKLGWCQAQTADYPGAIKTYTSYIEKNANSPTLPSAIAQRGLAYQQNKEYNSALKDFDRIIETYPESSERELALQNKALVLGQQEDYKGMTAVFRKLLSDYPKSPAAGQANFWIGWASFEEKDYKGAIENLETAGKLDPAQYGERAALRIILCYYYLQDRAALTRIIADNKSLNVPVEITRWLGRKSFDDGDFAATEQYLLPVVKDAKHVEPTVLIELAEAQIQLGKTKEAAPVVTQYLEMAREPYSRARGLQAKAAVVLGKKDFEEAGKLCDESLLLQPEGRLNAEGRLLSGEISYARGDYDGAARAFMTVAVLYDDTSVTPRALRRAADAYRKANNDFEAEKALQELQRRFPDTIKSPKISKEQ